MESPRLFSESPRLLENNGRLSRESGAQSTAVRRAGVATRAACDDKKGGIAGGEVLFRAFRLPIEGEMVNFVAKSAFLAFVAPSPRPMARSPMPPPPNPRRPAREERSEGSDHFLYTNEFESPSAHGKRKPLPAIGAAGRVFRSRNGAPSCPAVPVRARRILHRSLFDAVGSALPPICRCGHRGPAPGQRGARPSAAQDERPRRGGPAGFFRWGERPRGVSRILCPRRGIDRPCGRIGRVGKDGFGHRLGVALRRQVESPATRGAHRLGIAGRGT